MLWSRGYRLLALIGLALLALPACANAGTLLMWAGMGHLFIGNAIIGIIESFFISRIFEIRYDLLLPRLIGANYASMLGGYVVIYLVDARLHFSDALLGDQPLYRLSLYIGVWVAVTFIITVLIEWPFVRHAFFADRTQEVADGVEEHGTFYSERRILWAAVSAQLVSYALLAVYYLPVAGTGFLRNARVVQGLRMAKHPEAVVYYEAGGAWYRRRLDGSMPEKASWNEMGSVLESYYTKSNLAEENVPRFSETGGRAFDLTPKAQRQWRGRYDFWATGGLQLEEIRTGERFDLGLETPFLAWTARQPTILPGNQIIYQFGPQIVLFDIATRQMAFVAKGRQPVVSLR